ncbi:MAG TPA: hypothetical protein DCF44_04565 [Chitinophagaceae bacterium]|nr:hypothetical protein [Chitinophagaceae bacterium]
MGVKKNLKSGVACFRLFEAEAKAKASFGSWPLEENFLDQRATALNFWLHLLFQDKRCETRKIAISCLGNPRLNLVVVKYKRP